MTEATKAATQKAGRDALIPAATILMLRDGPGGLEVFMVVRHHQIDFACAGGCRARRARPVRRGGGD